MWCYSNLWHSSSFPTRSWRIICMRRPSFLQPNYSGLISKWHIKLIIMDQVASQFLMSFVWFPHCHFYISHVISCAHFELLALTRLLKCPWDDAATRAAHNQTKQISKHKWEPKDGKSSELACCLVKLTRQLEQAPMGLCHFFDGKSVVFWTPIFHEWSIDLHNLTASISNSKTTRATN
jgi:hypothetical protein